MGDTVDVLITTIGRNSLRQAILAALSQTYEHVRCVVLADGPCYPARHCTDLMRLMDTHGTILYHETPEKYGAGNPVKHWWINSGLASPWIRTLDDDDWMPPESVEMSMRMAMSDTVLVMGMVMTLQLFRWPKFPAKYRVTPGALVEDRCGMGSALFKTEAAQGIPLPHAKGADAKFLIEIAKRGGVCNVKAPVYWYRGYRTDKGRGYEQ